MALIQSSDLDFNSIKESLKTYLKRQSEFADYDFEASGLSNILDVLAYNTHLNGLIANFGLNESFLNSAQLRSSVVSHAETLGYYPRSKTSSTATVRLQVLNTGNTTLDSLTLPVNSTFSASVDNVSYLFQVLESYIALNDGAGNFTFKTTAGSDNIVIKEGQLRTKTFLVGDSTDQQLYVIPDKTMDTSTIIVKVFDSATSSTSTTYTNITNTVRINNDSTVFLLREAPNGFYELTFSDGNVLGQAPQVGNKIEITYLSATGAAANGASVFTADSQIDVNGTATNITVTTLANSSAGDEKETIASIKANAPISFATQQRLVTAEDYKASILSRYSATVDDVIAWGGNDNIPPIYGRVYAALKFKDGVTDDVKTSIKNSIQTELSDNLGIMSIDTVFSDPQETFIKLTTAFNFDPDLTGSSVDTIQTLINNTIIAYFNDNLNAFGKIFRTSALSTVIDALSPAILNTSFTAEIQQRLVTTDLDFGTLRDYQIIFPVRLSIPDDVNTTIQSSNFTFDNETCTIRNKLGTTQLQIINASGNIVQDNAGTYIPTTGIVNIVGVNITAFEGSALRINATPEDQNTIKPLRNYILKYDTITSRISGSFDYQNTAVTISGAYS